jgi:hypothetical protein
MTKKAKIKYIEEDRDLFPKLESQDADGRFC